MFILILVILGLSILILAHEAGHFFVAKKFNMKIEEFGFGIPPRIFSRKRGETIYSINLLPFGGFVKIAGENDVFEENYNFNLQDEDKKRFFKHQPAKNRALVTIAGVLVNFLIGWLLISLVLSIGKPFSIVVTDIYKNSPAALAGIQKGDIILNFTSEEFLRKFIIDNPHKEIFLKIKRNSVEKDFNIKLEEKDGRGFLGIYFVGGEIKRERPDKALINGFLISLEILKMNLYGVYILFFNLFNGRGLIEGIMGPVGIVSFSKQIGEISLVYLLNVFGVISVSLAFINLIPFPALDGGRLLFILIEKIKKSPISLRIERLINSIGFVLLLILIILITFRDINSLINF